ncbi:PRDM2 protein, partial [Amia calva]|nr:PRDM2 protein [Amia calva]
VVVPGGALETLDSVPPHVWRGLPDDLRLRQSAVNQNRVGVWASKLIPKGKKYGPFVGERKKRSQVTSNVYMWEVYFPAWGWMCVDATDPLKGNWLRYVNWARSAQEQNLFPLEINRTIYYKVLKNEGHNGDFLFWVLVETNRHIPMRVETRLESLVSSSVVISVQKKLLERAKQGGVEGFKGQQQTSDPERVITEMRESEDGPKEEDEKPSLSSEQVSRQTSASKEPAEPEQLPSAVKEDAAPSHTPEVLAEEEVEEEGEDEEEDEEEEDEEEEEYEEEGDPGKMAEEQLPEESCPSSPKSEIIETEEPPDTEPSPPGLMRMQRGGKELPTKRAVEVKPHVQSQQPQQAVKKEERFSVKTRERVGGPVTRSLQLASSVNTADVKTDDLSGQESREPQVDICICMSHLI